MGGGDDAYSGVDPNQPSLRVMRERKRKRWTIAAVPDYVPANDHSGLGGDVVSRGARCCGVAPHASEIRQRGPCTQTDAQNHDRARCNPANLRRRAAGPGSSIEHGLQPRAMMTVHFPELLIW